MANNGNTAFAQKFNAGSSNEEEGVAEEKFNNDIFGEVEFIQTECREKFNIELDPNLIFTRLEECNGHPDRVAQVLERFRPLVPNENANVIPIFDISDEEYFDADLPNAISIANQAFLMDEMHADFYNAEKHDRDVRKRRLSISKELVDVISPKKMQSDEFDPLKPDPSGLKQQHAAPNLLEKAGPSGLQLQMNLLDAEKVGPGSLQQQMVPLDTDFYNSEKHNGAVRKRRLNIPKELVDMISPKKMQTDEFDPLKPDPSGLKQQHAAPILLDKAGPCGLHQLASQLESQIDLGKPCSSGLQLQMNLLDTERAGPSGLQQQMVPPYTDFHNAEKNMEDAMKCLLSISKELTNILQTDKFDPLKPDPSGLKQHHAAPILLEKAGPSGLQQQMALLNTDRAGPSGLQQQMDPLEPILAELLSETPNPSDLQLTPTESEDADLKQLNNPLLPDIINTLTESLPDADIEYLTFLASEFQNPLDLNAEVERLLETKNYPKKKDKLEKERMQSIKEYYTERVFTPEDISKWHEEPLGYYNDIKRTVSELYKQHSIMQIYIDFPKLSATIIKSTLCDHQYHYFPTFCQLRQLDNNPKTPVKYKRKTKRKSEPLPTAADEEFYKELAFTKISDEYIFEKNEKRELQLEQARLYNDWVECQCCFEDQVLFEETEQCIEGVHFFCRNCVRKLAEEAAVNNSKELKCVASDCKSKFSLETIERVLKPIVYEKWLQRCQAEEIKKANLEDFVTCPCCDYGAIIENPEDKVFRCMNPSCGKETCRLCKEENHIPLRCNEVEKDSDRKARTYVEEEMADALIRTCPKCFIKFVKEIVGCNKMTCKCGQAMCYLCRQPIKDYDHFGPNKCPLYVDTKKLHEQEVNTRQEKAKQVQKENENIH